MPTEWYFKEMGETVGPLSASELQQFTVKGRIARDTFVRKGPEGNWVSAEAVKGLFGEPNKPTIANSQSRSNVPTIKAAQNPTSALRQDNQVQDPITGGLIGASNGFLSIAMPWLILVMNVWPFAVGLWLVQGQDHFDRTGQVLNLTATPVGRIASRISQVPLSPLALMILFICIVSASCIGFFIGMRQSRKSRMKIWWWWFGWLFR